MSIIIATNIHCTSIIKCILHLQVVPEAWCQLPADIELGWVKLKLDEVTSKTNNTNNLQGNHPKLPLWEPKYLKRSQEYQQQQ